MLELLWLLLPVAAGSGWYAARRSMNNKMTNCGAKFSSAYFKGLNYLLNEQPDKAIEVFIKMAEIDTETVETHLALGSLFRRKGEVDRGIHIHQNLIARPALTRDQRMHALLELGEDYMKAGLFDRAENLFLELVDQNAYLPEAYQRLMDIYQREQDWNKAIQASQNLQNTTGRPMNSVTAHFYCELGEVSLNDRDYPKAIREIKKALSADKGCVRANILQGQLFEQKNDFKAAIKAYKRAGEQDIEYLPEIIGPLEECYQKSGNQQAIIIYLKDILGNYDGISPILALAGHIQQEDGDQAAIEFVANQLRKRPSVRGLKWLIELSLKHSEGKAKNNLQILYDLISKVLEGKPVYKCNSCGFSGKTMHWKCPGCNTWSSIKPVKGVEGE